MNGIANRLQRSLMDETTRIELHVSKVCLVCLFLFNLIHNSNCKQYIGGKGKSFVSRSSNTNLDWFTKYIAMYIAIKIIVPTYISRGELF